MKDLTKKFFIILVISVFLITTVFATTSNGKLNGRFSVFAGEKNISYSYKEMNDFAIDSNGNIYLVDNVNNKIIKLNNEGQAVAEFDKFSEKEINKIDIDEKNNMYVLLDNNIVTKFNSNFEFISNTENIVNIENITDLSVDDNENIFLVSRDNKIIVLDSNFNVKREFFGSNDYELNLPSNIVIKNNYIYVIDKINSRLTKLDNSFNIVNTFEEKSNDEIYNYSSLDVDSEGNVYLSDRNLNRMLKLNKDLEYNNMYVSGINNISDFSTPIAIAINNTDLYVISYRNDYITRFKKDNMELIESFYSVRINEKNVLSDPTNIAISNGENIYLVDKNNNRILKLDEKGNIIKERIGIFEITGLAVNSKNNVYVSTNDNKKVYKLDADLNDIINKEYKEIFKNDINRVSNLIVDNKDNIYVTSKEDNSITILNEELNVNKVIKNDSNGNDIFNNPTSVAITKDGIMIVVDKGNNRIVKLNRDYSIKETIGVRGTGENEFNSPTDIIIDEFNNIYVTDTGNNRIVKISNDMKWITTFNKYSSDNLINEFLNKPKFISANLEGIYVTDSGNKNVAFMPYETIENKMNNEE